MMRTTPSGAVVLGVPIKLSLKQKRQLRKIANQAQELRAINSAYHENLMNRKDQLSRLKDQLRRAELNFAGTDFQYLEKPVEKGQYEHRVDYRAQAEKDLQELREAVSMQKAEVAPIAASSREASEDAGALTQLVDSVLLHCNQTFENLHLERV